MVFKMKGYSYPGKPPLLQKVKSESDKETEIREDTEGVTTNIKIPKVMKDGFVNDTQKAKIKAEQERWNALTPKQKKAEQDAANDKADKHHKRGKYAETNDEK
tara:strand:- start:454 stop:762 length:309 start_codon:yes stop_codon:yes gene_type:complete